MKKLRLGLIGCGIAASDLHFPVIQRHRNRFAITALCNRSREKAESLRERYKEGTVLDTYQQVLDHPEVEAVVISLPIPLNAPVSLQALKKGKHVLCEKPMAATPAEARKVVRAAGRCGPVYMVGESAAYNANCLKAKSLIKSGAIGKVYFAQDAVYWKHNENNKYQRTAWRKKPGYFGGFFFDGGVHFINQALELLGEAGSVCGSAVDPGLNKLQDNGVALDFEMKSGALLHVDFVMTSVERPMRVLRIFGAKANLELYQGNLDIIYPDGEKEAVRLSGVPGFEAEFLDFYEASVKYRHPMMGAAKGYRDVATLYAALTAAVKGRKIKI
jgi:predicted dehydrogenase